MLQTLTEWSTLSVMETVSYLHGVEADRAEAVHAPGE